MSESKIVTIPEHILEQTKEEIRSLRRTNEVMAGKLEVMELFACVLHTTPARRSEGMGEDILWKLEQLAQPADDPEPERADETD